MAWTQSQIDSLKVRILEAKSVSSADKSKTNHDLDAMLELLALMEADVVVDATDTGGSRTTYVSFSRD